MLMMLTWNRTLNLICVFWCISSPNLHFLETKILFFRRPHSFFSNDQPFFTKKQSIMTESLLFSCIYTSKMFISNIENICVFWICIEICFVCFCIWREKIMYIFCIFEIYPNLKICKVGIAQECVEIVNENFEVRSDTFLFKALFCLF